MNQKLNDATRSVHGYPGGIRMTQRFDAIVVGGGQAGPSLAVRLAGAGRKTALIERHLLGGTCVNVGCTPTKALVASAHAAHLARRGADFGVNDRSGHGGHACRQGSNGCDRDKIANRSREVAAKHAQLHCRPRPSSICWTAGNTRRRRDPGSGTDISQCRRASTDSGNAGCRHCTVSDEYDHS